MKKQSIKKEIISEKKIQKNSDISTKDIKKKVQWDNFLEENKYKLSSNKTAEDEYSQYYTQETSSDTDTSYFIQKKRLRDYYRYRSQNKERNGNEYEFSNKGYYSKYDGKTYKSTNYYNKDNQKQISENNHNDLKYFPNENDKNKETKINQSENKEYDKSRWNYDTIKHRNLSYAPYYKRKTNNIKKRKQRMKTNKKNYKDKYESNSIENDAFINSDHIYQNFKSNEYNEVEKESQQNLFNRTSLKDTTKIKDTITVVNDKQIKSSTFIKNKDKNTSVTEIQKNPLMKKMISIEKELFSKYTKINPFEDSFNINKNNTFQNQIYFPIQYLNYNPYMYQCIDKNCLQKNILCSDSAITSMNNKDIKSQILDSFNLYNQNSLYPINNQLLDFSMNNKISYHFDSNVNQISLFNQNQSITDNHL